MNEKLGLANNKRKKRIKEALEIQHNIQIHDSNIDRISLLENKEYPAIKIIHKQCNIFPYIHRLLFRYKYS